jgi:hypothetical protein
MEESDSKAQSATVRGAMISDAPCSWSVTIESCQSVCQVAGATWAESCHLSAACHAPPQKERCQEPTTPAPLGVLATPPCELGSIRAVIIFHEGDMGFAAENVVALVTACGARSRGELVLLVRRGGMSGRVRSLPSAGEREVGVDGQAYIGL